MAFQVLTAAVFAAQAIGTATSAVLTAAAAAGTAGLAAAASLASIAYTSYATKKAEADARKNAAQAPRDITVRSATEPAKIIYGTARTSGPVVYTNTAPTPGTSDNNTLWTVISLCSHEVEDITDIWLDGDEITASQINWGGTGGVTSGKYGPIGSNEVTNFYKRLGTSTQSHVSELATAFTDWTSSYQGKNVAYIVSAFELGTATGEGVWAQGAPTNIRAVVKGKKVYDPRKDTTNGGSGAHRLADPTTWEWSDNPALCLADYLFDDRLGLGAEGVTYDDIDWALVIAAANVCDATVSIPGSATEKRFTCNGALSTGNTYAENIKAILSSMNGQITWSGGKYRIRACAYEAPVYTFTGDDVVGDVQIQPERTRTQRFNTVRGTFVDPESDYVATEFIPYNDSNLQSGRDAGQKLTKDISLPMTNSEYMAQRIGYKMVALNDQQLRCIVPMNWKALKVGVGDRIQLSIDELSWSNKVFRVEGWTFDPDSGFNLTLQEDSSSAYSDPGVSDYSTRTLAGTVVFADQPVPSPSNLSATAEEEAVFLQWSNPGRASGYDEIIVYASATSAWSGASEIARTRGTSYRHELARNTQRYYWIRAVDVDGETSIRNPNSDTSAITATSGQIDFANLGGATKPEDNATYNTGALADKDTVGEADIDNGAVTIDKFGTGLEPVQVVSSLPGTATAGQMAFLTTDNKLYRYNGTAWTAAVPFGDVTDAGALAALDTITLTYVTDAGDVAALDTISETYIDDNSITTVKINANAVTAAKIQANTITAAQIAANTITANEIAANTITANQIAANTITANEIAANTITAGQIAAGTITADELAANAVTGQIFDASSYLRAGSGDNSAVMSGRSIDEYAFWAGKGFETDGGPSGADAPFRVTRDGKVIMTNFALYSEAGTKLFDSQDGLLALPQTAVAQASGTLVPQVSEELTSGTDTFTVTLSSTQTITANFAYPVGALFYSGTSLTDAQNNVSSAFAVTLEYSDDSGSTWNTFGSTQNFSKVTSGTPTSSQYLVIANSFTVSIIYGATPTTVYVASLQSNRGAIDEGMTLVGSTSQSLAAGTYLVRMVFSATGGSGSGAPSTTKTREVRLTTSGAGFTVSDGTVSDGVGTSATTGWVLSNFVEKTESDNVTINGTLTLGGDLVVNGTTTTINSTTLEVDDLNVTLASGAANAAAADGAGITIDGASATFTYDATNDLFESNKVIRSQNWVYLESAGTGQEAGIRLDEAGSAKWYVYKDNSNDSAFHIQSAGAAGEGDSTPRLRMSRTARESYFGGSLAVGKYSITSGYSLDVSGSTIVGGNLELGSGSSTGVLKLKTYDDAASEWHLYNYNDDTFRINYNGSGGDELILNSSGLLTVSGGINDSGGITSTANIQGYSLRAQSASPTVVINDTNATNDTDTSAFISFQTNGTERGYLGFGSSGNDIFRLYRAGGDIQLYPSGGNVDITTGGLEVGGVSVIDSSRGITGTVMSINSAGHAYLNINGASGYESGIIWKKGSTNKWETYVPNGSDGLYHYSYTLPGQVLTLNASGVVDLPSGYLRILNTGTDQKIQFQRDSSDTISIEHDSSTLYFWNRTDNHYTFKMTHEGLANARLGFQVNGTTVIDSGRDLKNIGVIESNFFRTKTNGVTYWGSASTDFGHLTWDTGYAEVRALNSGELRLGSTYSGNVIAIDTAGYLESRGNGIKMSTRYLARPSNWGYSVGYKAIILGSASTTYTDTPSGSVTLAFNYDPSTNSNGSFTGDGREMIFRNGTQFVTPNSANTAWNLYNLVLKHGNVGIGYGSPAYSLDVNGWANTASGYKVGTTTVIDSSRVLQNVTHPTVFINRQTYAGSGISWYSSSYRSWATYMAAAGHTDVGPTANITAPSGTLVTSWALRNFVENYGGYGWTFESGSGSSGQPSVVAEIRASDGSARFAGSVNAVSGYQINGTTRINSVGDGLFTSLYIGSTGIVDTNRNLVNIGTISSGAITSSGKIYGGGSNVSSGYTGVFGEYQVGASSGQKLLYLFNDGTTLKVDAYDYGTSSPLSFTLGGNGGDVNIGSSADLKMNGTTVIDSSRNLTNIGAYTGAGNVVTRAANVIFDAQSSADSQTVGYRFGYQADANLCGTLYYTTADAQMYLDNRYQGNNGVYSNINFRNKANGGTSLINRLTIHGSTGNVNITGGNLQMSGSTVIDNSRNISSGVVRAYGSTGGVHLNYASSFEANGAGIQITLARTIDSSAGWGGIGADVDYCFSAWGGSGGVARRFGIGQSGNANLVYGDYQVNGTSVITSGRDITNIGTATMDKLNLHAGAYQGVLTFGSSSYWRCGISQYDNNEAEMRIWHAAPNGMIFLTTDYNGEASTLSKPTTGIALRQGNVGIGNFSSSNPANYLHVKGTGDAQLTLDGDGTTWSGIRFQDGNGGNYLWMYGGTSTWAFGGGGSAVSGKRVHIDGGCTIGDTYDSATMPSNGLQVLGEIYADKGIRVSYSGDTSTDAGVYIANTSSDWGLKVAKGSYEYGIRNDTPSTSSYAYYQEGGGVAKIRFDGAGNGIFAGNVTAYGSPSDIRLKENVERIPDAVEKVKKLDGITFNYKEDGGRSTGLIAQQLLEVLPEVVYTQKGMDGEGEERYAVRYGNVVGLLVEAIKEQQTQIEALQTQLEELKNGDH